MEKLRDAFAKETDPAKQKAIAEAVQLRADRIPDPPACSASTFSRRRFRKNVTGLLAAPSLALWNIEVK